MRRAQTHTGIAGMAILFAFLAGMAVCFGPTVGVAFAAEEYILGPEDVISVTVWEHPELSRTAVVRANGSVTLPPLGDIPAAGKATSVLAREVERSLYSTLRQTTQVTITVIAFNSQKVTLAGAVNAPGRYNFEQIPDLMDLLGQAGGLGPGGDLSSVRIVRRSDSGQQTIPVDLSSAMLTGDMTGIPRLEPGDVVYVPSSGAVAGSAVAGEGLTVLGEVLRPGSYGAGAGCDLAQALAIAGGTTRDADLGRIEVLVRDELGGSFLLTVDLDQEMRDGRPGPLVRSGDTVRVPSRSSTTAGRVWGAMRVGLSATRDILNLFLIRDALND